MPQAPRSASRGNLHRLPSRWRDAAPARYGVALVSVALAIAGRLLLDSYLGDKFPFQTVFLAILFNACYGGFAPALLAVVVGSVGAAWFLLPPRGTDIVLDVAKTLRPLAEDKGLAFHVTAGDGEARVRADRRVVTQVLLNLVGNAINFTAHGGVAVSLESRAGPDAAAAEVIVSIPA